VGERFWNRYGSRSDVRSAFFELGRRYENGGLFATYHAKHGGEGGPVPPTWKETHTHYVYCITMGESDKVEKMVKIWNAPWAMKELGWV